MINAAFLVASLLAAPTSAISLQNPVEAGEVVNIDVVYTIPVSETSTKVLNLQIYATSIYSHWVNFQIVTKTEGVNAQGQRFVKWQCTGKLTSPLRNVDNQN